MTSRYEAAVREVDTLDWDTSAIGVNIPDHPEYRFSSPSGRYEVEISPVNGYDDGELHEDSLQFFVNVYTYYVEDGERLEEESHVFSRKKNTPDAAASLAENKIREFDQKDDA